MKKIAFMLVLILALSLVVSGCSSNSDNTPTDETDEQETVEESTEETVEFVDTSYIVDADWLNENLGNENILILDARGQDAYNKGHIPGAIAVTWQNFADMSGTQADNPNWGYCSKGRRTI